MATQNSGLKVPTRPAPGLPTSKSNSGRAQSFEVNESVDPFSPISYKSKGGTEKKAPPRPPPPRVNQSSRSIFGSSKKKQQKAAATAIVKPLPQNSYIPTGTLIDLQSPPNSPLFENKLKNSHSFNKISNNKPISQVESGFEDDFGSLLSSGATSPSNFDPWSYSSDFSPSPTNISSPDSTKYNNIIKSDPKPKFVTTKPTHYSKPTVICVPTQKSKPSRPPPPKNISRASPIINDVNYFKEKEGSPPMPSIPPPPPPPEALGVLINGPKVPIRPTNTNAVEEDQPYCTASYDYTSTHPDDLSFKAGDVILLIERVSEDWLKGKLHEKEGIFPESYVNVAISLEPDVRMRVIAIYPFQAETWDDLDLKEGDEIDVIKRINDDWLYGECEGKKGQFPECFVQDITDFEE